MEGDQLTSGQAIYQELPNNTAEYSNITPNARLPKEKLNSILILSIGFFALIIAGAVMWNNLNNPFADIIRQGIEQDKVLAATQQAELLAQQTKDTDGDGLPDYDELNKYSTSPYLKDSDSDGIDDKAEVTRGTDPNCPEGQNCFASASQSSSTGAVPTLQTSMTNPSVTITPDYIRQIMKQNGATDEQLKLLTDDELMAEFKKYLEENPATATELSASGVNINIQTTTVAPSSLTQPNVSNVDLKSLNVSSVADLEKLSGAQIRQLMVSAGGDATILAQVSDDELKSMFLAKLQANKTQ